MTVTTHIAEILRQGIWASLTGGWYYEPAHSIFCNTVHLYLWLVLLIVPLVVGLVTSGAFNISLLLGYTSFIGIVFAILKTLVSRVHVVFDTSEPIVTTKVLPENANTASVEADVIDQEGDDALEMVEMRELRRRIPNNEVVVIPSREDGKRMRIENNFDELTSMSKIAVAAQNDVEAEESDDDMKDKVVEVQDIAIVEEAPNNDSDIETSTDDAHSESTDSSTRRELSSAMARKMSEPVMTPDDRRKGNDDDLLTVRRANSTLEASCRPTEKGMLSQSSLDQARQSTHKSYPSKMSSVEEFRTGSLKAKAGRKGDVVDSLRDVGVGNVSNQSSSTLAKSFELGNEVNCHTIENQEKRSSDIRFEELDQPSTSIGNSRVANSVDNEGPKRKKTKMTRAVDDAVPSTSDWYPVVVSLSESDQSKAASISKAPEERMSGADIKVEITKFLEELIEKHPETLDVIENVRQSRLGRSTVPHRVPQMFRLHDAPTRRRSSTSSVAALSDMALRDGTHVATGHEDTSQGAVHSFQDADGMWWTYAFDEHGVGTAQPLGSGRALMELLQSAQEPPVGRNRLDVLPESAYVSSEDEGEPCSSRTVTNMPGLSMTSTRRERALSSSSNESYTYIPQLPTTVFHAPTGTGASRASSRHQMVSFANVASRLRAAVRQSDGVAIGPADGPESSSSQLTRSILDRRELRQRDDSVPPFQIQENFLARLDSGSSTGGGMSSRFRFLSELGLAVLPTAGTTQMDYATTPARRTSSVKKSYYYKMKVFPKTNKSFKLKLDRLSVSALFDRNRSILSCIFDVLLACMVSFLAGLVLSTGIYFDIWLFFFAFTVAGAHFSLLKSVQPDASSPIHGFNWLVSYSRPVYFCIGAVIVLVLHHFADDPGYDKIPWNWNPYRLYETSGEMILLAFRDLFATFLVMLPFAFTMGWLPQVNTLAHHILEQVEMHIFGGTASLGVFSAAVQIVKSLMSWAVLVGLCHLAYSIDRNTTQTPAFSAFLAVAVATSYLLSRFSSNPQLFAILCGAAFSPVTTSGVPASSRLCCAASSGQCDGDQVKDGDELDVSDPLPRRLREAVVLRARHDMLFSAFLALLVFALHSTSLFTATQPYFTVIIIPICIAFGIANHYLYEQLRTHTPWKLLAKPVLHSQEYTQFESPVEAKLMNFEIIHVWMLAIEKNLGEKSTVSIVLPNLTQLLKEDDTFYKKMYDLLLKLYPLVAMAVLTECGWQLPVPIMLAPLITLRLLRGGFSHPQLIYVPLALAFAVTRFDWKAGPPFGLPDQMPPQMLFPLILYILIVCYPKWLELYLKMSFVMAYVAPWQISWGSAFHAFAQPFSIPHSALIWTQTVISSLISAPLNPFLGSSFFTTSYVRPVKFWERDYNTKRSDASNTTLASQIDRGPMLDDSNLNAVFYEHLTRSLQKSLAGDLQMGRWATSVQPGDCFILASSNLNCLVHIIEVGNGFVTFQLRGLEFRGTYCHQREVDAISDDQTEGTGCCCCAPGSLPGFLSLNTAWSLRWLAWEVVTGKYIIDGYSITAHSAVTLLQVHEMRRLLVTLYVKCIIHYALASSKLQTWLTNETIRNTLDPIVANSRYADVDHMFCSTNDEDFDMNEMGISRSSFSEWYSQWISLCLRKRSEREQERNVDEQLDTEYVTCLCFVLSLLGRRALGAASYNRHSNAAESFLCGLHALFKGDFRITCQRDEWVFADMDLLRCVISPAVKMALKLHQDHFAPPVDFADPESLFGLIADHQTRLFISHEHDPAWRRAIIANTPSLLALRHVYDEGQDDYKIIMLNRMHLNMRVIKLNRECVRAFWAGQQQELIFLRNRNPERGSIQNARQVLRNMINSSADQPVGYPIYVSPLTTSFADTHSQMPSVVGPPITIEGTYSAVRRAWTALRAHFGPSGSSSLGLQSGCGANIPPIALQQLSAMQPPQKSELDDRTSTTSAHVENSIVHMTPDGSARVTLARRSAGSADTPPGVNKFSSTDSVAQGVAKRISSERKTDEKESVDEEDDEDDRGVWVRIEDVKQVFRYLNEPLKSTGEPLVVWPTEEIRQISGRNSWHVQPTTGQKGRVMYTWHPNHPNRKMRSHIGDAIHLVAIPEMGCTLVPVSEKGCTLLTEEREPTDYRSVGNKKQYLSFISKVKKDLYNWTMCGMTPYMTRPINTSS